MTGKRFNCKFGKHMVLEHNFYDKSKKLTFNDVVVLLNDLHEERDYFERKKCEYWNKFNLAHLDNINLRKENEQLKRRIGNLEHTRDFCDEVCADCERLENENEQLRKELNAFKPVMFQDMRKGTVILYSKKELEE